jgi:hypothetical protein
VVTVERAERVATIPPDVLPPAELTRVALRAERIAVEARAAIGRPVITGPDGNEVPATGLWKKLAPVFRMGEAWEEEQAAKKRGLGWWAERGTKLLDHFLPAALSALLVAVAAYVALHWR